MRAKFGGSAGLNPSGSGGKMSAIGSDPGYKPGSNSGGGINTAEVSTRRYYVRDIAENLLSLFFHLQSS